MAESKGQGWGGPAKGASTSRIRKGDPDGIQRMSNDPAVKARREERLTKLRDVIYGLAVGESPEGEKLSDVRHETKLAAAVAYLNREEGLPKAPTEITGAAGGPLVIERRIVDPNPSDPNA